MKQRNVSLISATIFFTVMTGMLFTFTPQASALEASTTMTVVNVTEWSSPDCTGYRKHDDIILSTAYHAEAVAWAWDPKWPAYRNSVSAAIWFIWSIDEFGRVSHEGKQWAAVGWDWVGNHTTSKHAEMWRLSDRVGLMFTTVCGPTTDCSTHPSKERSNIMFAPNPYAF